MNKYHLIFSEPVHTDPVHTDISNEGNVKLLKTMPHMWVYPYVVCTESAVDSKDLMTGSGVKLFIFQLSSSKFKKYSSLTFICSKHQFNIKSIVNIPKWLKFIQIHIHFNNPAAFTEINFLYIINGCIQLATILW